ncbi:MAG: FdtA/QdtA family cupin domain-containing protein [Bacteroidaceae bacterium]|nr:FdtA/QdtA family cupin domain-containing protein [Bacteroidaceae bacterium]
MPSERPLGRIIALPKYDDPRGNLTVADLQGGMPFPIARAYWITDVPGGESRGAHAHRQCREVIISVSGSFCITLDNGQQRETFHLKRPWEALLVETGVWRTLEDFSSGAVCLVLASHDFSEDDYIREYDEFREYIARNPKK